MKNTSGNSNMSHTERRQLLNRLFEERKQEALKKDVENGIPPVILAMATDPEVLDSIR